MKSLVSSSVLAGTASMMKTLVLMMNQKTNRPADSAQDLQPTGSNVFLHQSSASKMECLGLKILGWEFSSLKFPSLLSFH